MKEVRLSRGMAAASPQEAIRQGLVIANSPQPDMGYNVPNGLFYARNTTEGYIGFAEEYATLNVTEERPTPVVVHFEVTPENFQRLEGRLQSVEPNFGNELIPHTFTPVTVFEDLKEVTHNVLVDLSALGPENLTELDITVGFKQHNRYQYRPYSHWARAFDRQPLTQSAIAA